MRPQASRVDGGPGAVGAVVVLHGVLARVSFRHVSLHFSSATAAADETDRQAVG